MENRDMIPSPDINVRCSDGLKIPAHSDALASSSPVFEEIVERRRKKGKLDKPIPVRGVPSDAVAAFLGFLHSSSRCVAWEQTETMDKYGVHLMVLSHAYRVNWLKDLCEVELALRLAVETVVDFLQLSRECDTPKLYLQCMKLLHKDFAAVEKTEAWIFLQDNDPWLELEILQFLEDEELRQERRRKKMEEQKVYLQLSEAMECLQHICSEGCTRVGPHEANSRETPKKQKGLSCPNPNTCSVLQLLIKHLASCRVKRASCPKCHQVWDLLRLHSSICDRVDGHCKVPLCRQFKLKVQMEGKGGDNGRWRLLSKKVASVTVMSSLAKRRIQDLPTRLGEGFNKRSNCYM